MAEGQTWSERKRAVCATTESTNLPLLLGRVPSCGNVIRGICPHPSHSSLSITSIRCTYSYERRTGEHFCIVNMPPFQSFPYVLLRPLMWILPAVQILICWREASIPWRYWGLIYIKSRHCSKVAPNLCRFGWFGGWALTQQIHSHWTETSLPSISNDLGMLWTAVSYSSE